MDKNDQGNHPNKNYPNQTCKTLGFALRGRRRLALAGAVLATLTAAASSPAVAAPRAERSLAGIAIFAPGSEVTRKFGNPNQILVGGVSPASATTGGPGGPGGFSGSPGGFSGGQGGPGGFPGSGSSGGGTGSLPGFPGAAPGGGFPGASPGGFPGAGGGFPGAGGGFPGSGGGFPGAGGGFPGGAAAAPIKPPVTLIYNRPNGGTLEFTISPDKRVVQVRETGYSGSYATARGIKLGTSYSAVVARYGYPEDTQISGSIINIDYKDTLHCGFQFLDQRLVGIIVASPD